MCVPILRRRRHSGSKPKRKVNGRKNLSRTLTKIGNAIEAKDFVIRPSLVEILEIGRGVDMVETDRTHENQSVAIDLVGPEKVDQDLTMRPGLAKALSPLANLGNQGNAVKDRSALNVGSMDIQRRNARYGKAKLPRWQLLLLTVLLLTWPEKVVWEILLLRTL